MITEAVLGKTNELEILAMMGRQSYRGYSLKDSGVGYAAVE